MVPKPIITVFPQWNLADNLTAFSSAASTSSASQTAQEKKVMWVRRRMVNKRSSIGNQEACTNDDSRLKCHTHWHWQWNNWWDIGYQQCVDTDTILSYRVSSTQEPCTAFLILNRRNAVTTIRRWPSQCEISSWISLIKESSTWHLAKSKCCVAQRAPW